MGRYDASSDILSVSLLPLSLMLSDYLHFENRNFISKMVTKMCNILAVLEVLVSPTNQTKLMTALIVLPTYQFAWIKHLVKKSFIKLEFLPLLLYVSSCDHLSFLLRPECKHKKSIFRLYVTFITNWDGAMPLQISLQLICYPYLSSYLII